MSDTILLLMHPDLTLRRDLGAALSAAGHGVMDAGSSVDAWNRVIGETMPDVAVLHLGDEDVETLASFRNGDDGGSGGWIGDRLRSSVGPDVPIVVLTSHRREALRHGFADVLSPPYEVEDVVLTVGLALEEQADADFAGSLDKLSMPDLLQATIPSGRSGRIDLRGGARSGTLWFADGTVIDASTSDGRQGVDAVYEVVPWDEGEFVVDFGPSDRPPSIHLSLNFLLLEAMRRRDEALAAAPPEHATLPDEPPEPTADDTALHLSLLLLNVTTSWMAGLIHPPLLAARLEALRADLCAEHPPLARFQVDAATAGVAVSTGSPSPIGDVEALVSAIAIWLREIYAAFERSMPGRFSLDRLVVMTEAHRESLAELGFDQALGWSLGSPRVAPDMPGESP